MPIVGGTVADGRALPALYVFTSTYYHSDTNGGPDSTILNPATDKFFPAYFTYSPSGGMTDDMMLFYLRYVVVPCFPDLSSDNPIVFIVDGYGSHFTLEVLIYCRDNNIILILRPPHCSHIIQNEDVANFGPFKDRLEIEKSKLIAERYIKGGITAVRITRDDITKITKEPW